jgi:peptidoglycan/xylan/chitin deacetylase (PgdA/CDA1 family)
MVVIFTAVFAVSFLPQTAVPIYGGDTLTPIYNGNRENKNVSLMFNVYENTEIVNSIIDVLSKHGAKCTFFVGGCWADDNENTLKRIVLEGHEIANHGYFHLDHKKLNYQKNYSEIENCGKIVKALTGYTPTLFAPPSGSYSDLTLEACYNLNYELIMWSKDTIDWRDSDKDKIFTRATKNPENGDLILMHPKKHSLDVLPKILEFYKTKGYNIVSVSQNINGI